MVDDVRIRTRRFYVRLLCPSGGFCGVSLVRRTRSVGLALVLTSVTVLLLLLLLLLLFVGLPEIIPMPCLQGIHISFIQRLGKCEVGSVADRMIRKVHEFTPLSGGFGHVSSLLLLL